MSQIKLILKTFYFYWKKNLALALGVAISTAVITGSLVVGDSVSTSLENQVELRLGKTSHSLTAGDRFFTSELSNRINIEKNVPSAPVLLLRGIAVADGGQQRVPNVQILGISDDFDHFAGEAGIYPGLTRGEVIISENLAQKTGSEPGDQLLFRIRKASLIPLNAPFVSGDETSVAVRVKVKSIAGDKELGRFDLSNSQSSPMNAFFSLDYLNDVMELEGRANLILLELDQPGDLPDIDLFTKGMVDLPDFSLDLHYLEKQGQWELNSERVFIEPQVQNAVIKDQHGASSVLTYFVNQFKSGDKTSPYSFVSSLEGDNLKDDEILINAWLSDDLDAVAGDSIELTYYVVGPLRELEEQTTSFIITGVFNMDDPLSDSTLMPYLPGLSDAGSCSEWETGIPIDLEKIRDKDEDYWDEWRGTPKAIIAYKNSSKLWANRFGNCTAIRYSAESTDSINTRKHLKEIIKPSELGFQISQSKVNGDNAARKGTDFGQLFIGLSFFLLLAGIILTLVLFRLAVESRSEQLGTFTIMGFPKGRIRNIIFSESLLASLAGILLGLAITVFYNKLIFWALNNAWSDIVRTDALDLYFHADTLIFGLAISLVVVLSGLYLTLNRILKRQLVDLHRKRVIKISNALVRIKKTTKWLALLAGLGLILMQLVLSEREDPGMFFLAGGLLILSFLLFADGVLSDKRDRVPDSFGITGLIIRSGVQNRARSLSVIILFALGVFLVVTTGANHKDPYANAGDKSSGTGGFKFVAETTVPVLQNLNRDDVRVNFGLEGSYEFVQFRRMNGDDASCLNLNKISQPAILGVKPEQLNGRFSFISRSDNFDISNGWESLNQKLEKGVVPAIADQTVIQWGLGLNVGDTLLYQDESGAELKLLLIGGLANSIFQGHVIIADNYFLDHFPSSSGSSFFLLDSDGDSELMENELSVAFRDYGWDMKESALKLAEFNSVENTYLSIFMILGALGLLLGTVGLAIILVRNLLERSQELALYRALGYGKGLVLKIVLAEYLGLLIAGLLAGGVSAIIAVLPGLLKPHSEVSIGFLAMMVGVILINGILWILFLAYSTIRKTDLVGALRND